MKKYLSSYKLGDNPKKLIGLFGDNKKVAYISNAGDAYGDPDADMEYFEEGKKELESLGLIVKKLDLRDYFGKQDELKTNLQNFGGVFVTGGNTFVLRQAYKLSGFDEILLDYEKNRPEFVYSGFSAGICILAPSLRGIDICDDPNIYPYDDLKSTIWEGLGILDYSISPHYRSDHAESEMTEKEVQYYIDNKRLFKALKDGEVIIYE